MRSRFQREEERAWTEQMVGAKRRWFTTAFANVLLLSVLLGLPFARAVSRAKETWPRYARAAACLLGGEAAEHPGLGALHGVDAHLGTQVLRAWSKGDKGWVARCDKLLSHVAPEPAIFVWPPAKEGELRVREAVRVLRAEFGKLRNYRGESRVPHDPVRALLQLHRELESHADMANVIDVPPQTPVTYREPTSAWVQPSRVPIFAGADAVLTLSGDEDTLGVVAVDRTGVSYLKTRTRDTQQVRHVRPPLLEAFMHQGGNDYLLWALSREKCKSRSGGCEGKAMGISSVDMPLTKLNTPRWLASHPSGRLDRSLLPPSTRGGLWLVAAEASERKTELRGFLLPDPAGGEAQSELAPLRWTFSVRTRGEALGLFRWGEETVSMHAVNSGADGGMGSERTNFLAWTTHDQGSPQPSGNERSLGLLQASEAGSRWAAHCQDALGANVVLGTPQELFVTRLSAAETRSWESLPLAVGQPIHPRDSSRDGVVSLCAGPFAIVLARSVDSQLWLIRCSPERNACEQESLARGVSHFASLDTGKHWLVAYSGSDEKAQIKLLRLDRNGKPLEKAHIPSPCWEPRGGMCDEPLLTKLGSRVLLGARDQTDLLVLESPDDGITWRSLSGAARPF